MRKTLMWCTALFLLFAAFGAAAQEDYDEDAVPDYAFGIGLGLVDPDGPVEPYYTAGFRIRLGQHDRDEYEYQGGIQAFIEPEVGYWERDDDSDLLLGVNLLGLVPFRRVDYYFGVGAGIHFLDTQVFDNQGVPIDESDERLGMNAQFGIDVHVSESTVIFGTGRFDLVEGAQDEIQDKLILGLRFQF
jgi:hypothetical protein